MFYVLWVPRIFSFYLATVTFHEADPRVTAMLTPWNSVSWPPKIHLVPSGMDKREIDLYGLQDIIAAILPGTLIKQIARQKKVSKNTVKKYRSILDEIWSHSRRYAVTYRRSWKRFARLETSGRQQSLSVRQSYHLNGNIRTLNWQ